MRSVNRSGVATTKGGASGKYTIDEYYSFLTLRASFPFTKLHFSISSAVTLLPLRLLYFYSPFVLLLCSISEEYESNAISTHLTKAEIIV